MRLQTIGETIKSIEKYDSEIFKKYMNIDWKEIIKLRDLISHHYLIIDPKTIFDICKNDIQPLKSTIEQIIKENQ